MSELKNLFIKRSLVELQNGLRRRARLTVDPPALATFNWNGCRQLRSVAAKRGEPPLPAQLDVAPDLANRRLILVPTHGNPDDTFAVKWTGEHLATVNLAEAYLAAGLMVPTDHVQEINLHIEEVEELGWCLVGDLAKAVIRPVVSKARTEAAAAKPAPAPRATPDPADSRPETTEASPPNEPAS